MRREIRLGGFGGQGIVLAGYIIGRAALSMGGWVVMTQSYGPEMRGGRVAADVILDDAEPIDYPKVTEPDISVFMGQEAYDYYHNNLGQILIYDEDLVQIDREHLPGNGFLVPASFPRVKVYTIQANRIAEELGRRVVANIAMLGSFTALSRLLPPEAVEEAVLQAVPQKALDLNREAFRRGLADGIEKLKKESR